MSTVLSGKPFGPDQLDKKLFEMFPGLVIRKDLTQTIRTTCHAPSYVVEFLLGRYCANLFDDAEVRAGLRSVQQEIADYIPRSDETELLKSAVRECGSRKIIDHVRVELDKTRGQGVYWASLETTNLQKVTIGASLFEKHQRLLLSGVWSRITLAYNDEIRHNNRTYPFEITALLPIQVSHVSLQEYLAGRERFTRDEWIDVLVRTMGYETDHTNTKTSRRLKLLYLARLIPLVEPNYHLIELGPRQTGKSFCTTEFSPYATRLSGGGVTAAKLFVSNTNPPRPGLITYSDVIGFGETASSSFHTEDHKNLYKSYMESGQINRGTINVTGDAGFVWNGTIEFDPRDPGTDLLVKHLFEPLPSSIRDDAAFHSRWAAYLPGWEMPKLTPTQFTPHVGFILDYASELFHRELRQIGSYGTLWEQWFEAPGSWWSVRDRRSINRTFSGLTKLIFPDGIMKKEDARVLLDFAIELRLRVLLQLRVINREEFGTTVLSYIDRESGQVDVVRVEV
jgi:ATP-dependent Lon protease